MTDSLARRRAASARRRLADLPPVTLTERRNAHYYSRGGGPEYPSVTTICGIVAKGGLQAWHDRVALDHLRDRDSDTYTIEDVERALAESDRIRDTAADLGTAVHAALQHYADPSAPDVAMTPEIREHVEYATEWLAEHDITPIAAEFRVVREPLTTRGRGQLITQSPGSGGTVDLIAWSGEISAYVVIDYKTGNSKSDLHLVQAAAYARMLPLDIGAAYVLYTKRREEDGLQPAGIKKYYEQYRGICAAYDAVRKTSRVYDTTTEGAA